MFCLVGATYEPTARAKSIMADVRWAFLRAGLSLKEAALTMKLKEPQLSRELQDGRLTFGRFAALPERAEVELLKIRAARYGLQVVEKDLARLLDGIDTLLGKRRAAKMAQDEDEREEKTA